MTPGIYEHYKGRRYQLIGVARHSETEEELVLYRPLYGDRALWVRPKAMWSEEVERDGMKRLRFQLLEEQQSPLRPAPE